VTAQPSKLTYCIYCGTTYPIDGDGKLVHEHVMYHCTKHPLPELRGLANAVVMDWRRDRPMAESLAALERWLRTED
jgi:hypothetical protein